MPTAVSPSSTDPSAQTALGLLVDRLDSEIQAGLPNEQARRLQSIRNVKYYRMRGHEEIPMRNGENYADFESRPKLSLPFTRRVVNLLATKLYCPGPAREVNDDEALTKWLEATYKQCHADAVLQRADRMSHLNGMCAIQVGATGDPANPLAMSFYSGWHEVIPFELPGHANRIAAVVTIDCEDQTTTYRFWTADALRTYRTEKLAAEQTAGGRTARFIPEESGPNPYGALPFAFIWFEPLDGGVDAQEGLGRHLVEINSVIDIHRSDFAQGMQRHHLPVPLAFNVDAAALQLTRPTGFMHVVADNLGESPNSPEADLRYLQANLDVTGGVAYIEHVIDTELEALGLPLTAWRLDSGQLPSGEALIQEQAPMIEYARERRVGFQIAETDLARVCLQVAGAYYHRSDLLTAAANLDLSLTWPPVSINLPSTSRDTLDLNSIAAGFESRVQVVMRRFGFNRDQAEKHLEQVAKDEAWLDSIGVANHATAPPEANPTGQVLAAANDAPNVESDNDEYDDGSRYDDGQNPNPTD